MEQSSPTENSNSLPIDPNMEKGDPELNLGVNPQTWVQSKLKEKFPQIYDELPNYQRLTDSRNGSKEEVNYSRDFEYSHSDRKTPGTSDISYVYRLNGNDCFIEVNRQITNLYSAVAEQLANRLKVRNVNVSEIIGQNSTCRYIIERSANKIAQLEKYEHDDDVCRELVQAIGTLATRLAALTVSCPKTTGLGELFDDGFERILRRHYVDESYATESTSSHSFSSNIPCIQSSSSSSSSWPGYKSSYQSEGYREKEKRERKEKREKKERRERKEKREKKERRERRERKDRKEKKERKERKEKRKEIDWGLSSDSDPFDSLSELSDRSIRFSQSKTFGWGDIEQPKKKEEKRGKGKKEEKRGKDRKGKKGKKGKRILNSSSDSSFSQSWSFNSSRSDDSSSDLFDLSDSSDPFWDQPSLFSQITRASY